MKKEYNPKKQVKSMLPQPKKSQKEPEKYWKLF